MDPFDPDTDFLEPDVVMTSWVNEERGYLWNSLRTFSNSLLGSHPDEVLVA
jgi:hypothetical protein